MSDHSTLQFEPASRDQPYVGLRPFTAADARFFFGRKRDAERLCDKIFSSRLVLLYAPSGVGKSSLLQALVIPELRRFDNDGAPLVVYCDDWSDEDACQTLKSRIQEQVQFDASEDAASSAGTQGHYEATQPIAEDESLLSITDNAPDRYGSVILVLDQFEEFLVAHAHQLTPLQQELSELINDATMDVHVVVSLREEFLAALEPFHDDITRLYGTMHRLAPISNKMARLAIEEPARLAGVTYTAACVTQLLHDLRNNGGGQRPSDVWRSNDSKSATQLAPLQDQDEDIDLPMLQLVCKRLWSGVREQRSHEITDKMYFGSGGAARIIRQYIESIVEAKALDREDASEVLKYLVPSDGMKISCSVRYLVSLLSPGLTQQRIEAVVDYLTKHRILLRRDGALAPRYELHHDAFIKFLTPWMIRHQRNRRRRRILRWTVVGAIATASVALFVSAAVSFGQTRALAQDVHAYNARLREWRAKPDEERSLVYDEVSRELLWLRHHGTTSMRRLLELLRRHQQDLPAYYGVRPAEQFALRGHKLNLDAAAYTTSEFQIRYRDETDIDHRAFDYYWQNDQEWAGSTRITAGQWLASQRGLPAPKQFSFQQDSELAPGTYCVAIADRCNKMQLDPGRAPVPLRGLSCKDDATCLAALPDELRAFLRIAGGEAPLPTRESGGRRWWMVERATLPVWHTFGLPIDAREKVRMHNVADWLADHPMVLLTDHAITSLLLSAQLDSGYRTLVGDAQAVHGLKLKTEFRKAAVFHDRTNQFDLIGTLQALLHPPGKPKNWSIMRRGATVPPLVDGRSPEASRWLPRIQREIHIRLGGELRLAIDDDLIQKKLAVSLNDTGARVIVERTGEEIGDRYTVSLSQGDWWSGQYTAGSTAQEPTSAANAVAETVRTALRDGATDWFSGDDLRRQVLDSQKLDRGVSDRLKVSYLSQDMAALLRQELLSPQARGTVDDVPAILTSLYVWQLFQDDSTQDVQVGQPYPDDYTARMTRHVSQTWQALRALREHAAPPTQPEIMPAIYARSAVEAVLNSDLRRARLQAVRAAALDPNYVSKWLPEICARVLHRYNEHSRRGKSKP